MNHFENLPDQKTRVKICGLTRVSDALLSEELGASAIGLIFAASPRQVSIEVAQDISRALSSSLLRIGVFQNAPLDQILRTVESANLNGVQLHGSESLSFMKSLKVACPDLFILKTILIPSPDFENPVFNEFPCDALLFDIPKVSSVTSPIQISELRKAHITKPFFIAGRLDPLNIAGYLNELSPFGVDVCSPVEAGPGIKDPRKLKTFFSAIRSAHEVPNVKIK